MFRCKKSLDRTANLRYNEGSMKACKSSIKHLNRTREIWLTHNTEMNHNGIAGNPNEVCNRPKQRVLNT
jgi:hypothetical protein